MLQNRCVHKILVAFARSCKFLSCFMRTSKPQQHYFGGLVIGQSGKIISSVFAWKRRRTTTRGRPRVNTHPANTAAQPWTHQETSLNSMKQRLRAMRSAQNNMQSRENIIERILRSEPEAGFSGIRASVLRNRYAPPRDLKTNGLATILKNKKRSYYY